MDIGHCNVCGEDAETVGGHIVHDAWCATGEVVLVPKAGLQELLTALRLSDFDLLRATYADRVQHLIAGE